MILGDISKIYLGANDVVAMYLGSLKVWSAQQPEPPGPTPEDPILYDGLRITAVGDPIKVGWVKHWGTSYGRSWYSLDGSTWNEWDFEVNPGMQITLQPGKHLYLKGTQLKAGATSYYRQIGIENTTANAWAKVGGKICSMVMTTDTQTSIPGWPTYNYPFFKLFSGTGTPSSPFVTSAYSIIIDASELELPSTNKTYTFTRMFEEQQHLEYGPTIPKTLGNYCCQYMFYHCYDLKAVPNMPATTLAQSCYAYMFNGCSKLTETNDFSNIESFNFSSCCQYMYQNCKGIKSVSIPDRTLGNAAFNYMFAGSGIENATLMMSTLPSSACMQHMFDGCSSLKSIKVAFTSIPSSGGPLTGWVANVPSTGTFTAPITANYLETFATNAIPPGWTVKTYFPD